MYVDPKRNADAGNLRWILPYCRPDLPRVVGAIVMFCINNTMALVNAFRMNDGSAITAEQEKGFSTQEYKDAKSGWGMRTN